MFRFRLKELREKNKLSQYDLAKKLNIGQSTIGMWENGKNHPRQSTLLKLAEIFNVSVDYLLANDSGNITTGDVANNIETINTSLDNEGQTTLEKDMLNIFRSADGKTQLKIMRFMYGINDSNETGDKTN